MITTIRSNLKQSTYRYIIFSLIGVIGLSMISSMFLFQDKAVPTWAIRVNGADISYKEFMQEVRRQEQYMNYVRAQYGELADLIFQSMGWSFDPKTRALDSLIKEELMYQYSQKLGLVIDSSYITYALNNQNIVQNHLSHIVPAGVFDQSGTLNAAALKEYLKRNGVSAQEFEVSLKKALLKVQLLDIVSQLLPTPLFDLQQQFIGKKLGKQFSYAVLAFNDFLNAEKNVAVTDADLKAFFDEQNLTLRRYWVPEKRSVLVWEFNPADYKISISDEEIERYYEDNKVKEYVLDPLRIEVETLNLNDVQDQRSAQEIRADLVAGNANPAWNKLWKRVKPFSRTQTMTQIEKEAFLLVKEGDISPVIQTPEGSVVVRLVQRIKRTYKPLSAVKNDIVAALTKKEFKKSFAKDLSALIKKDVSLVDSFILDKAGKKNSITSVVKNDTRVSQEAFRLNLNEYGSYLDNDKGYLVLLTDIQKRNLPDFESLKEVVKKDYQNHRAEKNLTEAISALKVDLATKSLDEVTQQYGLKWQKTGMILPSDYQKIQKFEGESLPMTEAMAWEKVGSLVARATDKGGVVLKLDEIQSYDMNDFIAAQDEIATKSENLSKRLFLESFVASLYRNATIETNELIITQD